MLTKEKQQGMEVAFVSFVEFCLDDSWPDLKYFLVVEFELVTWAISYIF